MYVSSYHYISVLILYMCPHTVYVSSYHCLRVIILCGSSYHCLSVLILYVSSYHCLCVLILYMCPHTTVYVGYDAEKRRCTPTSVYVSSAYPRK